MTQLVLRRVTVYFALTVLLSAYLAPAVAGAAAMAAASKKPRCKVGKVAKKKTKRVKVTVRVRSHGKTVRKRVWKKKRVWVCVAKTKVGAGPVADILAPGSPSGLTATTGDKRVALVWAASTDNVGVTAYRVYRDGVLVGTVTTNSFTDAGVANGTSYKYLIVAVDAAGNASPAASIVAAPASTVDTTAPSAPPGFAATAGNGKVDLVWDASTDNVKVVFYQVFRDGVPIVAQEAHAFSDTGLVNGTTYTYTVFAHDSADNVSAASTVSATPADTQAPTVPAGLSATAGDAQVSLTWTAATDNVAVTGYRVYRDNVLVASPTTPYYADMGLTNGTSYSYTVAAVDGSSNASARSGAASATPVAPVAADTTPPSMPTGLTGTPGVGQVSLTWTASTDNVGVSGYRVFRDGVQIASPAGPSYIDTGRTNGVAYAYTVLAVDAAANQSLQSASVNVTPGDFQAPSVPSGLTATGGNGQVALSWSAASDNVGVTGYVVYRSSGGGAFAQVATPATPFYTDTGLSNGTAYSYKVAAVDAAANASAQSASASATPAVPADVQAPSTPTGLGATAGTNQVALAWTASTDDVGVTGYRVYRSSGGGAYAQVAAPAGTSYTDTGLTNGTTYSYRVAAVDAAANVSAQSAVASATPADTQAPTTPTGLGATAGTNQVSLSWTASTDNVGVTGYRVYRSSGGGAYAQVATPATPYYTDTGLTAGTAYSYKVAAVDAAANASAQSGVASATPTPPPDAQAPSTPAGLVATAGTNQVALSWTASTDNVGVTGYKVYRSSGGGAYTLIASPVGASYTNTGLTNGTAYSYKVSAVDAAANESAQSAVATATPGDATPPSVPANVTVTKDNAAHTITIAWSASTDNVAVVRYKVYRSKNGAAQVVAGQPTTTSYLESNLSNGATYAFQVSAVDAAGNESAKSPVVSTYVS